MPPLTGRVVDQTGTLSSGDVASLKQTLRDFEARKGSQIAVLIVPTTDGETIEQYSLRVAEAWKIGRKKIDDGAMLVVAKNDRQLRIEVGYGLEGALTDVTSKRIIDEDITPKFRSGDFAGGISAGVDRMIRVIDGEKLPAPEPQHWQAPSTARPHRSVQSVSSSFGAVRARRHPAQHARAAVRLGGDRRHRRRCVAWFILGSLSWRRVAGMIAFVFTLFGDELFASPAPGRRGGGRRLVRRRRRLVVGAAAVRAASGGFSGGGGSFGGGGASGSW